MKYPIGSLIKVLQKASLPFVAIKYIGKRGSIKSMSGNFYLCHMLDGYDIALAETEITSVSSTLSMLSQQTTPKSKNYGNECPCGILPSMCDYHKGNN
jgi:hypothetical protein